MQQGAYNATPVAIATNILNTIYPQNEKYEDIQRPAETISTKFFGSETFGNKFTETFSGKRDEFENYQQTSGVNFPNYESHNPEGYQDLTGTIVEHGYEEIGKRKRGKKKNRPVLLEWDAKI